MLAGMGPQERDLIVQRELDEGRDVLGPVYQDQQLILHTVADVVYAGYASRAEIDVAAARIVQLLKSRRRRGDLDGARWMQDPEWSRAGQADSTRSRAESRPRETGETGVTGVTDLQHRARSPAEYVRLQQGDHRQAATVARLFLVAGSPATYAISLILHGCKERPSR